MTTSRRASRKRGVPPQTAKRNHYLALMAQGIGNSAACRAVGINRRTGARWRYGRTITNRVGQPLTYPPILTPARPVSARFLSEDERIAIGDGLIASHSIRAIAAQLGRSPSTIGREIQNNCDPETGDYHPFRAQQRSTARRARPKVGKLAEHVELREHVQRRLEQRWSPEQISRTLAVAFPDRPEMRVAPETIYQALYVQGRGQLRRELTRALRTGRACRRPRRRPEQRTPRFVEPMVMISDRPAEAADRAVPGHFEGDLIMGTGNQSAIGTLVERTTRYVMLLHLPHGHAAEHVRDALLDTVATLPAHLVRSLTWDQGVEMARHGEFTVATDIPVYFCDPHSPWQRGSNENTNGLLRQYFPKGTDLSSYGPEQLIAAAAELNARPRKTLGWDSPAQRLAMLLSSGS
ncbi:MAG TPA: IS30 family transposase [Umezawaea sp.]|jgi:IS30 family transposase|nr:IS30 family transposase [Umezawaea sp.]